MPDDIENHMAESFPLLIADLQRGDVVRFEAEQKKLAEQRAALRQQTPNQGMTAGELLKKIDGDPEAAQRKLEEELARIGKEAQAAAAQKDKSNEPLPAGHFPPPPTSG
jgi:hypothetical protein